MTKVASLGEGRGGEEVCGPGEEINRAEFRGVSMTLDKYLILELKVK